MIHIVSLSKCVSDSEQIDFDWWYWFTKQKFSVDILAMSAALMNTVSPHLIISNVTCKKVTSAMNIVALSFLLF